METRTLLQIVLGTIITASVVIGVALVYELTRSPETKIIQKTFEKKKTRKKVEKNPWEGRGDEAIELVKGTGVGEMDDETREMLGLEEDDEAPTLEEVLGDETFVDEKLNLEGMEPKGWRSEWWGETKYGPYFYLVTYAYEDAHVSVGPSWLVDLKGETVAPKNIAARVATNPEEAVESEYYGNDQQVVSAMAQHTFESGINLGGTLLLYFEERADKKEKDKVLGWTIQHERKERYTAFFQWLEGNEPAYAKFEFDYDRKALKAVNLHAGNIMRVGESFQKGEPVNILPNSFDPEAEVASEQWTGAAAEAYEQPKYRDRFEALGTILNETDLISALEWLLRARAKTPEDFEQCKKDRKCKWKPEQKEEGVYRVTYVYNLGSGKKKVQWDVHLEREDDKIEPVGRLSKLAYRAVNPRQ